MQICNCFVLEYIWCMVFRKNCVSSQFTATPPSPTLLSETLKALNKMQVYSNSYWLAIVCTTNSSRVLARERWQTFEKSWKKTQYLMNTLYIYVHTYMLIEIHNTLFSNLLSQTRFCITSVACFHGMR